MSDALQTAIINWLRATADDAMGMEPGDRHMANETRKEIERLRDQVRRLQGEAPPLDKEQALKEMAQLSSYVDEVMAENERLQARVSELERQLEVKDEQFTTMQETYQARVAHIEASAGLKCPNADCNDSGGYPAYGNKIDRHGYPEVYLEQCEFCWTVPDSIFNRKREALQETDDERKES